MQDEPLIADNLKQLNETILETIHQTGRKEDDVKLIAVSKTHPSEIIQIAHNQGQWRFGENRIQDAIEKVPQLPDSIEWHFIGHLQKNKAKFCPGNFQWIHSIDSDVLVQTLEKRCALTQDKINVLIQANLTQETTKSGVRGWDDLCHIAERLMSCQWLTLRGLMTIADPQSNEQETRQTFATLFQWKEKLTQKFDNEAECNELSMGMSSDYSWAIQEGATLIRVGSAIFGPRR